MKNTLGLITNNINAPQKTRKVYKNAVRCPSPNLSQHIYSVLISASELNIHVLIQTSMVLASSAFLIEILSSFDNSSRTHVSLKYFGGLLF